MQVKIHAKSAGVVEWEMRRGASVLFGVIREVDASGGARIFVNGMRLRIGNEADDRWVSAQVRRTLTEQEITAIMEAWLEAESADDGTKPGLVDG